MPSLTLRYKPKIPDPNCAHRDHLEYGLKGQIYVIYSVGEFYSVEPYFKNNMREEIAKTLKAAAVAAQWFIVLERDWFL